MTNLAMVLILQVSAVTESQQSYEDAYNNAIANRRPLVVVLGADWCPACQVLKQTTLPEVARTGGLKNVELAIVDITQQRKLARQLLKGTRIPQMVRFSWNGKQWHMDRFSGVRTTDDVSRFVQGQTGNSAARLSNVVSPNSAVK